MIKIDYKKVINLLNNNNIVDAINLLKEYNDDYFINKINTMFTPSEQVALIEELEKKHRESKDLIVDNNQINNENISILEVLNILSNDEKAFFYPIHPEFEYKLLSNRKKEDDVYLKFTPEENIKCPFNNFTWHKEQLNLSILCKIDGNIIIPDKITDVDNTTLNKPKTLNNKIKVHQWRNYNLIFNGELHIKKLPISASLKTLQKLAKINDSTTSIDSNSVYVLDLSKLPLVSKKDISDDIYAKDIINLVIDDVSISAKQKIYKSLYDIHNGKVLPSIKGYNEEESNYLSKCWIKADGSYSPPIKYNKENIIDTVVFKIDIKGYSSIPSLKDLLIKKESSMSDSNNYSPPMLLVKSALDEFNKNTSNLSNIEKIKWLEDVINKNKIILKSIKKEIQKKKLILLLTRQWFKDLEFKNSEQIINIKTDKFPGKDEISVVIRIHRQEIKR